MQLPITKKALSWCACWVVMGAVAQSSQMAAGGVVALIVCAPATLAYSNKVMAAISILKFFINIYPHINYLSKFNI